MRSTEYSELFFWLLDSNSCIRDSPRSACDLWRSQDYAQYAELECVSDLQNPRSRQHYLFRHVGISLFHHSRHEVKLEADILKELIFSSGRIASCVLFTLIWWLTQPVSPNKPVSSLPDDLFPCDHTRQKGTVHDLFFSHSHRFLKFQKASPPPYHASWDRDSCLIFVLLIMTARLDLLTGTRRT